jgi:hypothetical protein
MHFVSWVRHGEPVSKPAAPLALEAELARVELVDPVHDFPQVVAGIRGQESRFEVPLVRSFCPETRAGQVGGSDEGLPPIYDNRLGVDPNGFSPPSCNSPFQILLGPSRHQGLGELAATPAVFLSTDSPVGFEKQLSQSHRRRPYVRAAFSNGPGAEGLEKLLLSVVRGTSLPTGTTGPVFVRGYIAASCTVAKLVQSAGAGDESLAANVMWFVDGDGGAMPPKLGKITCPVPYKIQHRYQEEVQQAWRTRLDHRNEAPAIPFDWQPAQRKWVAFLQSLEPRCAGVTLAARPLLTTLLFGCLKLHEPGRPYD